MRSKESQVAEQVRLKQWALEVQECLNRPKNMTVQQWCEKQGIKKAAYYWRLKRVRQACLEQAEISTEHFVELTAPEHHMIPSAQLPAITNDNPSTAQYSLLMQGFEIIAKRPIVEIDNPPKAMKYCANDRK